MSLCTEADFAYSVYAADVDGDGDVDVLSAGDDKVAWYEHTDGEGTFAPRQVVTTEVAGAESVYAADVDGDGDVDVLSASSGDDKIAWYENRLAGDADDDGEVAFADFLTLANNFGHTNSVWEDGDFNGDGAVDFSDFLILSNSFGESRSGVVAPTLPATTQFAETRSPANIAEADDLFARFDADGEVDVLSTSPRGQNHRV